MLFVVSDQKICPLLTFELMDRLDTGYLLSSSPVISKEHKQHIIFDTKLQQQLNIMVRIHEHSYDHLRRVFGVSD